MTLSQRLEQAGPGEQRVLDADLLYLVELADWCAGQGFCQVEGIEDPEEWCFRKWRELGPPDGEGYSALALAAAIAKAREV